MFGCFRVSVDIVFVACFSVNVACVGRLDCQVCGAGGALEVGLNLLDDMRAEKVLPNALTPPDARLDKSPLAIYCNLQANYCKQLSTYI